MLRLSPVESLTWEQTFLCDGFPVLHAAITLPAWDNSGAAARRLNRYYRALFRRLRSVLSTRSRRRAEEDFHACQRDSLPFSPHEEEVTFTVTLDQCSILSILVQRETVTNQGHFLRQLGDVWRSTDGYPISARAFLTVGSRKELGSLLSRRAPNHSQKQLLRRFDPYRFFLTETQLHLYYPAGTLNASDREILTISLPLSPGPVQFL